MKICSTTFRNELSREEKSIKVFKMNDGSYQVHTWIGAMNFSADYPEWIDRAETIEEAREHWKRRAAAIEASGKFERVS